LIKHVKWVANLAVVETRKCEKQTSLNVDSAEELIGKETALDTKKLEFLKT